MKTRWQSCFTTDVSISLIVKTILSNFGKWSPWKDWNNEPFEKRVWYVTEQYVQYRHSTKIYLRTALENPTESYSWWCVDQEISGKVLRSWTFHWCRKTVTTGSLQYCIMFLYLHYLPIYCSSLSSFIYSPRLQEVIYVESCYSVTTYGTASLFILNFLHVFHILIVRRFIEIQRQPCLCVQR